MPNLITLGCSLTHQAGWAQYVSECMHLPLFNLAQSAGSNQLQQKRIQELILRNELLSDDIVIWQLTSTIRYYNREMLTKQNQEKLKYFKHNSDVHPTVIESKKNLFDNNIRIDYLCNSVRERNQPDEAQLVEDILFHLIAIKKITPNIFVFLGWNESVPLEYQTKFKQLLNQHQINFIDPPLVDWCHSQHLKFDLLEHPTVGSASKYARDVLIPVIENQLNIKIETVPIWAE